MSWTSLSVPRLTFAVTRAECLSGFNGSYYFLVHLVEAQSDFSIGRSLELARRGEKRSEWIIDRKPYLVDPYPMSVVEECLDSRLGLNPLESALVSDELHTYAMSIDSMLRHAVFDFTSRCPLGARVPAICTPLTPVWDEAALELLNYELSANLPLTLPRNTRATVGEALNG